jgi:hypothetical protein
MDIKIQKLISKIDIILESQKIDLKENLDKKNKHISENQKY